MSRKKLQRIANIKQSYLRLFKKRRTKRDELVGTYEEARDRALFDNNDLRGDKSLMLQLIDKSAEQDITTLNHIKSELAEMDDAQDTASELIKRLETQREEASELIMKSHENDLPPINSPDTQTENNSSSSTQAQPSSRGYQDSRYIHREDFTYYSDDIA